MDKASDLVVLFTSTGVVTLSRLNSGEFLNHVCSRPKRPCANDAIRIGFFGSLTLTQINLGDVLPASGVDPIGNRYGGEMWFARCQRIYNVLDGPAKSNDSDAIRIDQSILSEFPYGSYITSDLTRAFGGSLANRAIVNP